ncbi:MAG TPA: DNRLRE domain-containing protein [Verrucomicrobiae bacterium]|nr:DNRLRE domain-containing protein [Verrucomicrobiae bacterium]
MNVKLLRAAAIFCVSVFARGATLVVPASEDTTLFELNPTFNLGTALLGAGAIKEPSPDTGAPARMRALLRFDLSEIPAGSTITSAQVTVTVVRVPFAIDPPASAFELHRLLRSWSEGTKGGAIAGTGEATWIAPKAPSPTWAVPGAGDNTDASPTISSSVTIEGLGAYTFASTPALTADVQNWLNNPASNFGWMMRSVAENLQQSARRFANRESGSNTPTLTIGYNLPPPELRILQFELRAQGMFLAWTGGAAPYRVERAENILGPWTGVTAASAETQATAPAASVIAFYRVVSVAP